MIKTSFKNIPKPLVIVIALVLCALIFAEFLWLFVLPEYTNSVLKTDKLSSLFNQKTGLSLKYDDIVLKTTPLFNANISTNNLVVNVGAKNLLQVKKAESTVSVGDLLFKKVNIKTLKTEDISFYFSRKKDGMLYFGTYKIPMTDNCQNKYNLEIKKLFANTKNTMIVFDDKKAGEKSLLEIKKFNINKYEKDKFADINIVTNLAVNGKKSVFDLNASTALPLKDGISDKNFKIYGTLKNVNLANYSGYIRYFSNGEIVSSKGIIDADISSKNEITAKASLKEFALEMKNPLDSVKADSTIFLDLNLNAQKDVLEINEFNLKSSNWKILTRGLIKNYKSKNPELDIKTTIPDSDVHSLYWLAPSVKEDPQMVMQKFKKYGAWGKVKGNIEIKGKTNKPEVYGNLEAYDFYIVKNNPLVPHCKLFAEFLKDKVKVKTRVFAGYGEYVDVEGVAEMKINGAGEFVVKSSPNVDLATAEYMLVPVHEVVGFDIGPVPYMTISGKGNIELYTKGTVIDGIAVGQFNFKNTNAVLEGLNTKLENADGALVFDKRDMHFYTNHAYIKKQSVKVDGMANLDGNIDFDVTSPSLDMEEMMSILNGSSLVADKKTLVEPIEKISGPAEVKIKIKGVVKDFGEILKENTLKISGSILMKNNTAKLKIAPVSAKNINGKLDFSDSDWNADLSGNLGSSKFYAAGNAKNGKTVLRFNADRLKTDELLALVLSSGASSVSKLPKTDSFVDVSGNYQSDSPEFKPENLTVKGRFIPTPSANTPVVIQSGRFSLSHGNAVLENFNAKFLNAKVFADGKINRIFSQNPVYNYKFDLKKFDLKGLDTVKNIEILPSSVKSLLNAYEGYGGIVNVSADCRKNKLNGNVSLEDVKFVHSFYKTPIDVESGNILLDNGKIKLQSMIANVDGSPVFINASVWDLDKTAHFNGYVTTKLTEHFVNKYVNAKLTYPIKPKGDVTVTADISGTPEQFTVKPKIILAKDADIYYMGANLGNEDTRREIIADLKTDGTNYTLRNAEYVRFMHSQNGKVYPLTVLKANGAFLNKNKNIYIRNLNIETKNSANAKIFNALFKKSILKNGIFNCKLNIKGSLQNPVVRGHVLMDNLDMPLYSTVIKQLAVDINDKIINIKADGTSYSSDFSVAADVKNNLIKPYVIENLKIHSKQINIDNLIDSLTHIPTPNTMIKMSGTPSSKVPVNIADVQIKNGTMTADNIIIRGLPATNYSALLSLEKDMILKIDGLAFDLTTGKIVGSANYNFADGRIKAELAAINVDSNKVASSLFDMKDQIFGHANGNLVISTKGSSEEERIKNLTGFVYFDITDGKMPKLGSVEYLLKAGNLIKSGITGASISNLIDLIAPIKTGHFDSIKGKLSLKNGVAQDIEVYSKGDKLNLYINGEYDILQQYANLKVYGRLTKKANNILGAVGNMSFNSLLNAIPGIKLENADKIKLIKDLNKIPGVELSGTQYRVFSAKIDGNINSDKYVRSFRWIE